MVSHCRSGDVALAERTRSLAEAWRHGLARTNYVPLSASDVRAAFGSMAADVLGVLLGNLDCAAEGRQVGAALVRMGYVSPEALGTTVDILVRELETFDPGEGTLSPGPRLAALLSAVAVGFASASRERLLEDQEATHHAVLRENRRAGEAIRRQAALLDLAPDAILVRSPEGTILFWNRGAETLYGWSRAEATGTSVHELLRTQYPSPRETVEAIVKQLGRWEGELVQTCRDGSVITVSSRWAHQLDENGYTQAILEINTDITARKQMESTLREREASLEVAQSIAHLGSWDFNVRNGETHWSSEAYRLLGYQEGEIQPSLDAYLSAVEPEDLPVVQRAVQDAMEGHSYAFEFRTRERGGARILQSQSDAVKDDDGRMLVLFGTILDVTERKRAEAERTQLLAEQAARVEAEAAQKRLEYLAWASARLATSLEYNVTLQTVAEVAVPALGDACTVHILLDNGEITRVAEAYSDGRPAVRLDDCWTPTSEPHPILTVLGTGESVLYREVAALHDQLDADTIVRLQAIGVRSIIVSPLPARGRTLGTITCFAFEPKPAHTDVDWRLARDISLRCGLALDNARLHAEAQQATSLRDEFLSVAAHELKTPMTTLRGYTQLLSKSTAAGSAVSSQILERSVNAIDVQSAKLVKLTEQLLDVSRLQAGKLQLNPVAFDLVELTREVVLSVQQSTERHSVSLDAPETCLMHADPTRLEQMVANLVGNAVKYSPNGGRIEVTLSTPANDQGTVEMRVRDWGLGIPPNRRPNLFERFYQAHGEGHFGGLGLGLFVSRQIVELHAGTIHAEFPDDGGSVFVVRLPVGR